MTGDARIDIIKRIQDGVRKDPGAEVPFIKEIEKLIKEFQEDVNDDSEEFVKFAVDYFTDNTTIEQ